MQLTSDTPFASAILHERHYHVHLDLWFVHQLAAEVIPDLPLEEAPPSSAFSSRASSPSYQPAQSYSQSYSCEWCNTEIRGSYAFHQKQMLFMTYRKGIFCSRQCLKRASWNGVEGTKHKVEGGEIIPLHFIE